MWPIGDSADIKRRFALLADGHVWDVWIESRLILFYNYPIFGAMMKEYA